MSDERSGVIREIVEREWRMFDRVHNEGGRADCQDDWQTFRAMRESQMKAWTEDTLQAYRNDLEQAEAEGRNLVEEKYARMMASTAPERYARLERFLPRVSEEKRQAVERIVKAQMDAL